MTRAAVLYVFRVMVDDDIPMNAGCLRPIRIVIPKKSMLSPEFPAAVVAGNVETSQEVTNCLFGALGAMAAAQGTMNNLNFGNARYQYYETICSGSPAGPGFPGTDAVHTHMTNTRLTDPEILEFRYPVLLEDFHIRKGSGGRGQWNAGDGIRRTIRFLEKMECTVLSGHRRVPPFGLAGGGDGQVGENWVRRKDGAMEKLQGCDATVIDAGEAIIIQTPTAGGYGKSSQLRRLRSFRLHRDGAARRSLDDLEKTERQKTKRGDAKQDPAMRLMLHGAQHAGQADRLERIRVIGSDRQKGADHEKNQGASHVAERSEHDRKNALLTRGIEHLAIGRAIGLDREPGGNADETCGDERNQKPPQRLRHHPRRPFPRRLILVDTPVHHGDADGRGGEYDIEQAATGEDTAAH